MGKPESGPPSGQSVEQLLSSIRQAIEADSRLDAATRPPQPAPGTAPAAPAVHPMQAAEPVRPPSAPGSAPQAAAPARVSVSTVMKPQFAPKKPEPAAVEQQQPAAPASTGERDDVAASQRYSSGNPYRFRYSLEGSQTYMSLRNRLSSLSARTRADTGRSMASLLGGDVRKEEARARQYRQPEAERAEEPPMLRSSLAPEDAYVEEYAAAELASGSVSYSPDYHEWSMEQTFEDYGQPVSLPGTGPQQEQFSADAAPPYEAAAPQYAQALPAEGFYAEAEPEIVYEPAQQPEPVFPAEPEQDAQDGGQLQLDAMIRAVIEPELAEWFDVHMPDHVARAMPDEEAFIAMIRPLIEDWLEDNLAPIVERAVKDEIARITGLKR